MEPVITITLEAGVDGAEVDIAGVVVVGVVVVGVVVAGTVVVGVLLAIMFTANRKRGRQMFFAADKVKGSAEIKLA